MQYILRLASLLIKGIFFLFLAIIPPVNIFIILSIGEGIEQHNMGDLEGKIIMFYGVFCLFVLMSEIGLAIYFS